MAMMELSFRETLPILYSLDFNDPGLYLSLPQVASSLVDSSDVLAWWKVWFLKAFFTSVGIAGQECSIIISLQVSFLHLEKDVDLLISNSIRVLCLFPRRFFDTVLAGVVLHLIWYYLLCKCPMTCSTTLLEDGMLDCEFVAPLLLSYETWDRSGSEKVIISPKGRRHRTVDDFHASEAKIVSIY